MAAIYLKHPIHGTKVACGDLEAQMDRENGWEDYDPTIPSKPSVPAFLSPTGGTEPVSDLPPDFPGREALIAAGLLTWESLVDKTAEQLQEIKGIGPATATSILNVLAG